MKNTQKNGFTLVELIIVMVLLGILAAVAVPRMSSSIQSAEENTEQKFLSTIESALEVYALDEFVNNSAKRYPGNPFEVLEKAPQTDNNGKGWKLENQNNYTDCCDDSGNSYERAAAQIVHTRNDNSSYQWNYDYTGPRQLCCNSKGNSYTENGYYTISGPGYNGDNY